MRLSNKYFPDLLITYSLIILSIIGAYILPGIIKTLLFILILFLFYRSHKDYIYLALLFFIIDGPGGLFMNQTENIISISILDISFAELFSIIAFLKYFKIIKKQKYFPFKRAYSIYFYFLLAIIIYGLIYGMKLTGTLGTGLGPYRRIVKMMILFPLFYIIPVMLNEQKKLIRFIQLLFSFTIINFLFQLINIRTGFSIHNLLVGELVSETDQTIRPIYGVYIGFISFTMSLYFLGEGSIKKQYNYIIILVSLLSIIIIATRGWMIAYFFFIVVYYIVTLKLNIIRFIIRMFLLFVALFFLLQINIVKKQLLFSFERFSTLELILEGDKTAGGTTSRLTDRSELVMEKFYQRPLIGWGFTSTAFNTYDIHVGNQNMLMCSGIIGYFIFLFTLFKIISVILKCKKDLGKYSGSAKYLHIFIIALGALFIIHSSSTDLFSYMAPTLGIHIYKLVFLSIFFSIITVIINNLYFNFRNTEKNLAVNM